MDMETGPADGTLTLHTTVEGRAAKMGHALTIALERWSASTTLEGSVPTAARLRATLEGLSVVHGEGGVKSLSDKDKQTIRGNALESLKATSHPDVTFTSDQVTALGGGYDLTGQLTVAGVSRPMTVHVETAETDGRLALSAVVPVVQSDHGVKPYSAMMGGLKVADRVEIRLAVTVARP